ncbi:MAG: peptide chain release factor N(5)-glutamine methyltransferase [bacterium]
MSHAPEPDQEPWTIQRLLGWTTRFFETKGIETARVDAELLLAHALGWERIQLYARFDHQPGEDVLASFRRMVRHRAKRVPARYLTGETEFYSLTFAVSPAVLIPRPETEFLVERALELLPSERDLLVADLGTGCGAIAVAVARQRPGARVVATDASPQALEVARANARRHQVAERIDFRQGQWFAALRAEERFEALLSNPPYVARGELEQAMPEVRDHEPRAALDGGPDGLDALRVLVAEAPAWLKAGGWLVVEMGQGQANAVRRLAEAQKSYTAVEVRPDYRGIPRIASMQKEG